MNAIANAIKTIDLELAAIQSMKSRINGEFAAACKIILEAAGRVVVLGMGKSGIIGQKIAATLASTGTTSFFVHPGEAFHGDLGMIKPSDIAILISHSGETEELIRIIPFLQYQNNKIIVLTGNMGSTLARNANVILDVGVELEACNNNLAPTSSTTCTLVMGDALAVALSTERNFKPEDFARFHPGGSLGRKLLTRVSDLMKTGELPICNLETKFKDVIHTITSHRLGLAIVLSANKLAGIITDGDVRRSLEKHENPLLLTAREIMTTSPLIISPSERFAVAEDRMREAKVNSLLVADDQGYVIGVLQIFDQQGFIQ